MRDLVIIAGPAHTGSSHVQLMLVRLHKQLLAASHWRWADGVIPGHLASEKGFAGLVSALLDSPRCKYSWSTLRTARNADATEECVRATQQMPCFGTSRERRTFAALDNAAVEVAFFNKSFSADEHLVISSERFPLFACHGFRHHLERFVGMMAPVVPRFVLTIRPARLLQWRSGFEQARSQQIVPTNVSFATWICNRLTSQFASPSHSPSYDPLGTALTLAEVGSLVDVIDSAGVSFRGLDLMDPILCLVLRIDCAGAEASPWANLTRSRENVHTTGNASRMPQSGFGTSTDAMIEELFFLRDCLHWSSLSRLGRVRLLYPSPLTLRAQKCGDVLSATGHFDPQWSQTTIAGLTMQGAAHLRRAIPSMASSLVHCHCVESAMTAWPLWSKYDLEEPKMKKT